MSPAEKPEPINTVMDAVNTVLSKIDPVTYGPGGQVVESIPVIQQALDQSVRPVDIEAPLLTLKQTGPSAVKALNEIDTLAHGQEITVQMLVDGLQNRLGAAYQMEGYYDVPSSADPSAAMGTYDVESGPTVRRMR